MDPVQKETPTQTPLKIALYNIFQILVVDPLSFFKRLTTALLKVVIGTIPQTILILLIVFELVFVLNYFNIFSLSSLYPQYFGALPHRYDPVANNAALARAPYSQDLGGYQIDAKLYKIQNSRVSFIYKNSIVEFLLSDSLTCSTTTTRKISNSKQKTTTDTAFCSDILDNKNIGKKANITFTRDGKGYSYIQTFSL